MEPQIKKTDAEWKAQLSDQEYEVLRKKGTERPYTGEYWDHFEKGTYVCAACENVPIPNMNRIVVGHLLTKQFLVLLFMKKIPVLE